MILKNGKIVLEDKIINCGWIEIIGNKITSINEGKTVQAGYDLNGLIIMPGFIDCHVHGGYGYDFEQGTIASFQQFAQKVTSEGVTKFCQATVTNSIDKLQQILTVYAQYMQNDNHGPQARNIGAHLEGPFISKEFKGAHEAKLLLPPNIAVLQQLIAASGHNIRLVTYAPELQDGNFTTFLLQNNIIPAMGHSAALFSQVAREVENGAHHFTHLHNGMSRYDHRHPAMINAGLYFENILCELITDNVHNHPDTIKATYKIKGANHLCIITDAMSAKGMNDGNYHLGNLKVKKHGNIVTLANGTLAGSAALYHDNARNMYQVTNCSLIDLSKMTSINIAKQLQIFSQTGSIAVNKLADLVIIDANINVKMTICEGEIAYNILANNY